MLKDGALLQLELLLAALDEGMILKDSSPYNVQWLGSSPCFIDIGSFEKLRDGEPWIGYRQFCMLYLYPLFLMAYKGIPFSPWLRGSIDGISPAEARRLMSFRDLFRRGVFKHIYLHAKLETRYDKTDRDIRQELRAAGFNEELIKANVKGLVKLIRRLRWRAGQSAWSAYEPTTSYTKSDAEQKAAFIRVIAKSQRWKLVMDLGCNDGHYSRIASEGADYVVAIDADPVPIEKLYTDLKKENSASILPLTANVANPSPNQGWRDLERKALMDRAKPDLILCLALIHHVTIGNNIPVAEFIGWLSSFQSSLIIEFPTKDDPMVKKLLARKRPGLHSDYDREFFEGELAESFDIVRKESLSSGVRYLYYARSKK